MDSSSEPLCCMDQLSGAPDQLPPHNPSSLYNPSNLDYNAKNPSLTAREFTGGSSATVSHPLFSTPSTNSCSTSSIVAQSTKSERPSKFSRWILDWITDWWGFELVSWSIAALSMLAIFLLLEIHKNKALPKLPFKITLNSLISILATISQMAMMKPVVECISQLKWLWFVRKEKLLGFQVLDDASRGPTGSLILLGKLRGLHLVSLGAAITVLSIAFGSFIQQAVTYPSRLQPVGMATTPLVISYTGTIDSYHPMILKADLTLVLGADDIEVAEIDPNIQAAIFEGLGNGVQNLSTIKPNCNTGNCTWEQYTSLGICSNVVDLSASILKNSCDTATLDAMFEAENTTNPGYPCFNYTLPLKAGMNGYGPSGADFYYGNMSLSNMLYMLPLGHFDSMPFMNLGIGISNSSLITFYLLYQPALEESFVNSSLSAPLAYEMTLDTCLHTYNTTVSDSITKTALVSSQIFDSEVQPQLLNGLISHYSLSNTTSITFDNQRFVVSNEAATYLAIALEAGLINQCSILINQDTPQKTFKQINCLQPTGLQFINAIKNSTDPMLVVMGVMENVAIALTNSSVLYFFLGIFT